MLVDFVGDAPTNKHSIQFYNKSIGKHRGDFLTVINDMNYYPCLGQLKQHYGTTKVAAMINKYKEEGKTDAGHGNIFFDREKCSAACQPRDQKWYRLAAPGD